MDIQIHSLFFLSCSLTVIGEGYINPQPFLCLTISGDKWKDKLYLGQVPEGRG
jgi:hypothetical protein